MEVTPTAKCSCQHCGVHLEFPRHAAGTQIDCPQCHQKTVLTVIEADAAAVNELGPSPQLTAGEVLGAFSGGVTRTRVSLLYQLGLFLVCIMMVLLPALYVAMILGAGWGTYWWATHFSFLLNYGYGGPRIYVLKWLCYFGLLFAGVVLVFFMVKPLFARRAPHAQPLALNPGAEPLLFCFITKICETVGAPMPERIDLDCQLNAAAGFRRGAASLLGNDLVLTIGLPLVAGLNARQFAGVLAHEFGHFTQGFGMRLSYVIRSVNGWFARVIYDRDAWDVRLEEWAQEAEDGWVSLVIGLARLGVWSSRLLLTGLMMMGHGISCFMLRQMEYDADSYAIKVSGSETFEASARRIHVLKHLLRKAYTSLRSSWFLNNHLPDNFPAFLLQHEAGLPSIQRTHLEDRMGLDPTGLFDTHPSDGDRIRLARQANEPGVFHLDGPATAFFSNFEVLAKQITILHYSEDLQVPMMLAKLRPVEESVSKGTEPLSAEPALETPSELPTRLKWKLQKPG